MTLNDQKFIENPQFLNWIFNSNPAIASYWEEYLTEHPEEKTQILELKQRLSELQFTNKTLSSLEKQELTNRVNASIQLDMKSKRRRLMLNSFMKYAAVALIFLSIGGAAVYLRVEKSTRYEGFAWKMTQIPTEIQGAVLITSNGENVNLKNSQSTVDYTHSGAVILNNDSVIQATDNSINELNQLIIPYGNQSRIVLSDSTVVWLNAGSRLSYPTLFKNKTREVFLMGEAFFEVSKNPEKPFIVKTSDLDIRVLGTKFNVSAYQEDDLIQTVLKEGSVDIRRQGPLFFKHHVVLKPNQLASFDKTTNETTIDNVDADYYTLWTKGLISFEDIELNRIIKQLERFYNVSINISDPEKKMMRISGKLDLKQERKEVMEYLEKVTLSRFEQVKENEYLIK